MSEIKLTEAPVNEELEIVKFYTGTTARHRLNAMGLHPRDKLIKITNGKWGPVLIQNISSGSSRIAIGRGLADKITVRQVLNNDCKRN